MFEKLMRLIYKILINIFFKKTPSHLFWDRKLSPQEIKILSDANRLLNEGTTKQNLK
jgi:hypothetical protein